jgi:ABC-type Zn uptake system ZnuABC Zn-binding protein ZnuA
MASVIAPARLVARLNLMTAFVTVALATILLACSTGPGPSAGSTLPAPEPDALKVVTTTTVLADLVRQVGGASVSVESLVPRGGEVHTFDPGPSDVVTIGEAQLVVLNGLGLDEWLGALVADAGSTAPVVELADDLDGVEYLAGRHDDDDAGTGATDAHAGQTLNPHLWLNAGYARGYVARIGEALAAADPDDSAAYEAGAADFDARLAALDDRIRTAIGAIPESRRRVASFHEGFAYFAAAYGLEIVGVIVDAPGQDPSAGELAALVEAIRASGARAVFTEAQFSPDLAETVAAEAGVTVVRDLYNDSLGDPPVDTYEAMMRWNADRIAEALGSREGAGSAP